MAGKAVCGLKPLFNISAQQSRHRDRSAKNETSSTQSDVELTHTHLKYRIGKCAFHNAAHQRAKCALTVLYKAVEGVHCKYAIHTIMKWAFYEVHRIRK
jgi:hypothetical protein